MRYLKDIFELMGRPASLVCGVIGMGTLLGLMDLGCIAMLASLVGATSNQQPSVVIHGLGFEASMPVLHLGLLLIALYSARALLGVSFYYNIYEHTGAMEASLKARLMERFSSMSYENRLKRSTGSLLISINQWTVSYGRGVLAPLLRFCCDAMVGIVILFFLLFQYPLAVIFFLVFAALLGIAYDHTLKRLSIENARKFRALSEEVGEVSQQALGGYKEIRVLGLTTFFRDRIQARSDVMMHAWAVATTIGQSPRLIIEAVVIICGIIALLYLSQMGQGITHQLPQLAMLTFVVLRVSSLISLTNSTISNLRLYRGVIGQLAEDCRDARTESPSEDYASGGATFVSLEASNISFTYEGTAQPVLNNFSCALQQGDAIVVIGASGSGKTTIVDVLLGILKPTSGALSVKVMRDNIVYEQPNLMGVASYLSQTAFILNDTLRRNVALGVADERIDDARVMESLRKAKLPDYANAATLDAILGDRGAKFSGGQRQRVVLARAFYHGHSVMVLDEATNAIDLATEIEIVQDLLALRAEITLIAITHRPEIAKLFPKTLDLSQGRVL